MDRFRPGRRIESVQAPIIPTIAELIRSHPGTVSLGQGVAWYGPPPQVLERVSRSLSDLAIHRYGAVQGEPQLLELIARKLARENRITMSGRSLLVTAGSNMGFLNALMAITDPGDEVILPSPYYFNQEMAIRMVDCRPVCVPTDERCQPVPAAIANAITERTRAVVTISPNNPTGAVYSEATLREINRICRQAGLYHISDEAYENFLYDDVRHFSPGSIAGAEAHTISLFSLSKAYGFAGWRIGYMAIPEHLYPAILKVQDTNLICPTRIAQQAAIAALEVGSDYCRQKLEPIRRVRRIVLSALSDIPHVVTVPDVHGAFYVLPKVHTDMSSLHLAERLVERHGVAVIPGIAFGLDEGSYLRIAYGALDERSAEEGMRRLVHGLKAEFRV